MIALPQQVRFQRLAAFSHRYVMLGVTLALVLGAIWLLDPTKNDESTAGSGAVTLTGVTGGVTPRVGEGAPDFTLLSSQGQRIGLSDYRGHPLLVNFWATWCPPSRSEMPDLQSLTEQYADQGLVVLGVDMQEDQESVGRYAQTLGLTFPIALDRNGSISTRYNVTGLPTSYLVDRDGIIRALNIGPLTPRGWRTKLAAVLA